MPAFRELLSDLSTSIAVVGATDERSKYGAVIYRDLKRKGFTVYPVNPNRDTVDGDRAYPTLADLPAPPDIVDLVVPAGVGVDVVREALEEDLHRIWVQPGAESPQLLTLLQESDADYEAHSCIMVESRHALG